MAPGAPGGDDGAGGSLGGRRLSSPCSPFPLRVLLIDVKLVPVGRRATVALRRWRAAHRHFAAAAALQSRHALLSESGQFGRAFCRASNSRRQHAICLGNPSSSRCEPMATHNLQLQPLGFRVLPACLQPAALQQPKRPLCGHAAHERAAPALLSPATQTLLPCPLLQHSTRIRMLRWSPRRIIKNGWPRRFLRRLPR